MTLIERARQAHMKERQDVHDTQARALERGLLAAGMLDLPARFVGGTPRLAEILFYLWGNTVWAYVEGLVFTTSVSGLRVLLTDDATAAVTSLSGLGKTLESQEPGKLPPSAVRFYPSADEAAAAVAAPDPVPAAEPEPEPEPAPRPAARKKGRRDQS